MLLAQTSQNGKRVECQFQCIERESEKLSLPFRPLSHCAHFNCQTTSSMETGMDGSSFAVPIKKEGLYPAGSVLVREKQ